VWLALDGSLAASDRSAGGRETLESLADLDLGALVAREVVAAARQGIGQVLLIYVVALEVVGYR